VPAPTACAGAPGLALCMAGVPAPEGDGADVPVGQARAELRPLQAESLPLQAAVAAESPPLQASCSAEHAGSASEEEESTGSERSASIETVRSSHRHGSSADGAVGSTVQAPPLDEPVAKAALPPTVPEGPGALPPQGAATPERKSAQLLPGVMSTPMASNSHVPVAALAPAAAAAPQAVGEVPGSGQRRAQQVPRGTESRGETSHHWSEAELPKVTSQAGEVLRIFCGVWNLHGKQAPADLSPWVLTWPRHHVYVVGTCECERSIEKSMVWSSKTRWEQQVRSHLGEDFFMIGSHNMSAIHVMVFVHRYLWKYCWDIKTAQVATGFCNLIGNKGGTQIGFRLGRTSILFVHAHLAAHAGKMKERTQSLTRILVDSPIKKVKAGVHEDYDRVFFMGDLNPRLNASRSDVDSWLEERQLGKCLEQDQLLPLLHADPAGVAKGDSPAGMWPLFEEAVINFPPTYKFDTHTDRYDTSKKQRVPSWTDRILWKRDSHIRSMAYTSVQSMQCSDHRPIFAQFEVVVDLDNWAGPEQPDASKGKSAVCSAQ